MRFIKNHKEIYMACFLYSFILSFLTISRFNNFRAEACDMALFDQIIWNTSHGNICWITFLHKSYLAEHFSPILIFISPIYWIFDDPRILLVIQSLCFGFSALPLYLIAFERFNNKKIALIFAISYLITPKLWAANFFDFHQEAFMPLFLLATFYNLEKKNLKLFLLFLFLTFLCREDVAIYSAVLSIYIIFVKKLRFLGSVIFAFSVLWGIIAIKFIIPSFSHQAYGIFSGRYTYLGNNFFDIVTTPVLHPCVLLKHLSKTEIVETVILLFQRVLFLPFLSPLTFFLIIPPLFINITSDYVHQYVLSAEYVLPVLQFLFISAIYGYHKLMNVSNPRKVMIILFSMTLLVSFIYGPSIQDLKINHIFIVFYIAMLFWSIFGIIYGKLYIKKQIVWLVLLINIAAWFSQVLPNEIKNNKILESNLHVKVSQKMIELIPRDSAVSAQARYLPHLSHRKHCYLFPDIPREVEYIALDKKGYKWPLDESDYEKHIKDILNNLNNKIIFDEDGVILIKVEKE